MKKTNLIYVVMLALLIGSLKLTALDSATETEQLKKEVVAMAEKTLPQKKKALKTKTYTGSIDDIITARIKDVNEVVRYCDDIQAKAKEVSDRLGFKESRKNAIKKLIRDKSKQDMLKIQENNNKIIGFVTKVAADPNSYPDPNDPNYTEEVEAMHQFVKDVIKGCNPI